MRKFQFENNKYYHVYNRGVEKRDIFLDDRDFIRFIRSMREFNVVQPIGSLYEKYLRNSKGFANPLWVSETQNYPLVEFTSYCLNLNHYHLLIKQKVDGGISEFIRRLSIGYTNYFNNKYNRSGVLFQGKFKAIEANSYSHFLKLLIYVNCNYEVHKLGKAEDWIWSSYLDSVGFRNGTLCNLDIIKDEFQGSEEFRNFCKQVLPDIIENKELKKYLLE